MDSPVEVAQALAPMIKGKVVCDLGSHTGKFAADLNKYAKKVICVDKEKKDLKKCKKRGLETVQGDIYEIDLPKADIYYAYVHIYDSTKIVDALDKGILILSYPKARFKQKDYPKWIESYPFQIDIPFKPTKRHEKFKGGEFKNEKPIWRIMLMGKF